MAGEKSIDNSMEAKGMGLQSNSTTKVAEPNFISQKDSRHSASVSGVSSSGNAPFSVKRNDNQNMAAEGGVYYPPSNCYGYYYPGYGGTFAEWDTQGYLLPRDNFSLPYSGQRPTNPVTLRTPEGPKYAKTDTMKDTKISASLDSKSQFPTTVRKFSISAPHFEPSNKHGSTVQAAGPAKGYCYATPFSSYAHQLYPQNGSANFLLASRKWAGNERLNARQKFSGSGELDWENERTRGPRANRLSTPLTSTEEDKVKSLIDRDQYNRPDFETKYEDAMFFVIKSFSEDDIHKCAKYKVWASTQAGNKKLDAAFHDAEARSNEKGSKCPIFLFFSVNGSGQFVGLAEMTGQVDFKKTMEFWQQDKWTGFFPVKWHIVKDISNSHLRHIILENNDNKPVTNSRDTQEIKFNQGLEMLSIFKNFPAKSSLLDDFYFYEEKEKSLHAKRGNRHLMPMSEFETDVGNSLDHLDKDVSTKANKLSHAPKKSLVDLAKNLSLNSQSADKNATGKDLSVA